MYFESLPQTKSRQRFSSLRRPHVAIAWSNPRDWPIGKRQLLLQPLTFGNHYNYRWGNSWKTRLLCQADFYCDVYEYEMSGLYCQPLQHHHYHLSHCRNYLYRERRWHLNSAGLSMVTIGVDWPIWCNIYRFYVSSAHCHTSRKKPVWPVNWPYLYNLNYCD